MVKTPFKRPSNVGGGIPISLRVTPALYDALRDMAEADDRSMNNYIIRLLMKAIAEREKTS